MSRLEPSASGRTSSGPNPGPKRFHLRFTRALGAGVAVLALVLADSTVEATEDLARARTILQAGFHEASAARLRPLFPQAGRVFLSLPSLATRGGYVSPDQCFYLLEDLFHRLSVRSFSLVPFEKKAGEAGSRHRARGRLEIRLPGGGVRSLEIHFLLAREDGAWRLREVRENYRA